MIKLATIHILALFDLISKHGQKQYWATLSSTNTEAKKFNLVQKLMFVPPHQTRLRVPMQSKKD